MILFTDVIQVVLSDDNLTEAIELPILKNTLFVCLLASNYGIEFLLLVWRPCKS